MFVLHHRFPKIGIFICTSQNDMLMVWHKGKNWNNAISLGDNRRKNFAKMLDNIGIGERLGAVFYTKGEGNGNFSDVEIKG